MPKDENHAHSGKSGDLTGNPRCPGCSVEIEGSGRGLGKVFHDATCRRKFHALHKSEGGVLAPLIKAANATRHAKDGTREAEICRWARGQIAQITRMFLDRDEDEGRDVVAYVGSLMDSGSLYIDRMKL